MPPKTWSQGWKAQSRQGDADGPRSRSPPRAASSWQGGMRAMALSLLAQPLLLLPPLALDKNCLPLRTLKRRRTKLLKSMWATSSSTTSSVSGLETLTLTQKAKDAGTPGLESWSRLGGGGKHPQNAHRDLLRALLKKRMAQTCVGPTYLCGTKTAAPVSWSPYPSCSHMRSLPTT